MLFLLVLFLFLFLWLESVHSLTTLVPLLVNGARYHSLDEWLTALEASDPVVRLGACMPEMGQNPYIIVMNHHNTQFFASFTHLHHLRRLTCRPFRIVCYEDEDYGSTLMSFFTTKLDGHIRISKSWSPEEKEARIVAGTKNALENGYNVLMYVDPKTQNCKVRKFRSLYRTVLAHFPGTSKVCCFVENAYLPFWSAGPNHCRYTFSNSTECVSTLGQYWRDHYHPGCGGGGSYFLKNRIDVLEI